MKFYHWKKFNSATDLHALHAYASSFIFMSLHAVYILNITVKLIAVVAFLWVWSSCLIYDINIHYPQPCQGYAWYTHCVQGSMGGKSDNNEDWLQVEIQPWRILWPVQVHRKKKNLCFLLVERNLFHRQGLPSVCDTGRWAPWLVVYPSWCSCSAVYIHCEAVFPHDSHGFVQAVCYTSACVDRDTVPASLS